MLDTQPFSAVSASIDGNNSAGLTRQINAVQMQLLDSAAAKTDALAAARHIDLDALRPPTNRLARVPWREPGRLPCVTRQPPVRARAPRENCLMQRHPGGGPARWTIRSVAGGWVRLGEVP